MSRDIIFSCVARLEFDEAILWYDEQQPGLGDEFEAEINHVIEEIQKTPERFRLLAWKLARRDCSEDLTATASTFTPSPTTSVLSLFSTERGIRRNCAGG